MYIDPVCGKSIEPELVHCTVEYRGVQYYLCCPLCRAEFAGAPERYAEPYATERTGAQQALDLSPTGSGFAYTTTVARRSARGNRGRETSATTGGIPEPA